MGMDRREFIKSCSLVAVMGLLFGCRKLPLDELAGDLPSLSASRTKSGIRCSRRENLLTW